MKGFRTLVTGLAATALAAGALASPGVAWAETPTTSPTITAPADGATVSGIVAFTATSSAPRVRLQVGATDLGTVATVDATAAFQWNSYAEGDGARSVTATDCSATDECAATGHTIMVVLANLHPTITSQAPNPFSPNGNKVKDTTTTTYALTDTESVTWTALDGAGTIVRGPVPLGTKTAGTYSYVWDGRNASGTVVANGTYTVWITGENGTSSGRATGKVVVDTLAPTMTGLVRATVFYPYPDGYRDTFLPTVVLNERATLTLTVRNSVNTVVRRISAVRAAGRGGIAWNGRNTAGVLVPAGVYRWTYTAVDVAGNARVTSTFTVTVSRKRLVAKTAYVTLAASRRTAVLSSRSCAVVKPSSYGSTGMWLYNNCNWDTVGPQAIEAHWSATLPAAVSYSRLTVQVYGHTHGYRGYQPVADAYGGIARVGTDSWVARRFDFTRTTAAWVTVVSASSTGLVSPTRRVVFGFGVGDGWTPPPNDVDLKYVRLVVIMKVLV